MLLILFKRFLNFDKNRRITFGFVKIFISRLKPIAFRLPIARVFEIFANPSKELSKHPFTVKVSKPNSFLNKKSKDWLCNETSLFLLLVFFNPEKIEYS